MEYIISVVTGYLLGSIPGAYIVMKKLKGVDITSAGSGNAGAMNSFEVSNSKVIGILVLLIDAVKGMLSVYLPLLFFEPGFIYPALALLFAVLSHCYNPWLEFKGGRGLATAAGGALLLFPYMLIIWLLVWVIVRVIKKDILFANIAATIMTLIIIYSSADIVVKYTFPKARTIPEMLLFASGVMIIIFNRHIDPLKEIIHNKKFLSTGKKDVERN